MTRIGWLQDDPGYVGGAELTMREFWAAAPEGVELVECRPGAIDLLCDVYVVGNCQSYSVDEVDPIRIKSIRYHHDVARAPADELFDGAARHLFCSPLQRAWMEMQGRLAPPALDLAAFRRSGEDVDDRHGAVCIGRMAYGKGLERLTEYPERVDVYSTVPFATEGSAHFKGPSADVAATLAQYERFVFLPSVIEPFGRAVVEAWASGMELILNRNVGAVHWISERPEALDTAAADFWEIVVP